MVNNNILPKPLYMNSSLCIDKFDIAYGGAVICTPFSAGMTTDLPVPHINKF